MLYPQAWSVEDGIYILSHVCFIGLLILIIQFCQVPFLFLKRSSYIGCSPLRHSATTRQSMIGLVAGRRVHHPEEPIHTHTCRLVCHSPSSRRERERASVSQDLAFQGYSTMPTRPSPHSQIYSSQLPRRRLSCQPHPLERFPRSSRTITDQRLPGEASISEQSPLSLGWCLTTEA